MSGCLSLHMLPAGDGDCLLIQALSDEGAVTSMLIDGGREESVSAWRPILEGILGDRPVLDLLVVMRLQDRQGGSRR